tara:strand:- start:21318 stop:21782 length:465 start_codon:yes stop_codon:yes gene_type:complete
MSQRVPKSVVMFGALIFAPILLAFIASLIDGLDLFLRANMGTNAGRLMNTQVTVVFFVLTGAIWSFGMRSSSSWLLPLIPIIFFLGVQSFGGGQRFALIAFGFLLLLPLDFYVQWRSLAPKWWLRFKIFFTPLIFLTLMAFLFRHFIRATLALS